MKYISSAQNPQIKTLKGLQDKSRKRVESNQFVIEGIKTTIPFHIQLMNHPDYIAGNYTTKFMEDFEMEDFKG